MASHLPYRNREISAHPTPTQNILSLRRKAKYHTEGISLAACGKYHSPKANITVQPAAGRGCTLGDRESVDEACRLKRSGGRMISSPTVRDKSAGIFLPPSGREGDHEVVEGARGTNSRSRRFHGRGGACSSRISGQLKTCGDVTKERLQLLKNQSPSVTAQDFVMIPDHIHTMIFLRKKAGGAMPFVANGIAPPLP